ncbi:MAG TPA: type II toxin-antitoxin system RelE/ParE family toxin [Acidimicrobiia bacterium]
MAYRIQLSPSAKRALETTLPDSVASAVWEFITGPLAENPHRVGKPLRGQLEGRWTARRGEYRVIYRIEDSVVTVTILRLSHRRDAYRV